MCPHLSMVFHSQEHQDDVLSVAYSPPACLATASYDGEIVIWNLNSEQASRHLTSHPERKRTRSSRRNRKAVSGMTGSGSAALLATTG